MSKTKKPQFSRILLKLSGEALGGPAGVGICAEAVQNMAEQISEVRELGVQVVVVVGGGNIFRGLSGSKRGVERATGDYMGMLRSEHGRTNQRSARAWRAGGRGRRRRKYFSWPERQQARRGTRHRRLHGHAPIGTWPNKSAKCASLACRWSWSSAAEIFFVA